MPDGALLVRPPAVGGRAPPALQPAPAPPPPACSLNISVEVDNQYINQTDFNNAYPVVDVLYLTPFNEVPPLPAPPSLPLLPHLPPPPCCVLQYLGTVNTTFTNWIAGPPPSQYFNVSGALLLLPPWACRCASPTPPSLLRPAPQASTRAPSPTRATPSLASSPASARARCGRTTSGRGSRASR